MTSDPVIKVRGLKTAFGPQVVHDNLDIDVYQGEIIGVVGGSGTGKSVLLRSIIGLLHPVAGSIEVLGKDIIGMSQHELLELAVRWGVLFQHGALFTSLTVAQNIEAPLREHTKMPQQLMDEIASYKLSMVGLPPDAGAKFPAELSGGMIKRAALARSLALDPDILFLDEPTSGLDPIGAAAFDGLIRRLRDALGLTVFLVTHDLDTLHAICDRVAVIYGGKIAAIGAIPEVEAHATGWVKEYFSGPRGRAAGRGAAER